MQIQNDSNNFSIYLHTKHDELDTLLNYVSTPVPG